jgi:hypothetical protein
VIGDFEARSLDDAGLGAYLETNHISGDWPRPTWELEPLVPAQCVDPPGLGSALTHNTEVALNWLPSVDAPLSERNLTLFAELEAMSPA